MAETKALTEQWLPSVEELEDVIERAKKGDASALPKLRLLLKDRESIEFFGGDLAQKTELTLIQAASGDNLALRESIIRKMQLMREDLAGANPTPLEKLMIDRVVLCWLILHDAEIRFSQFKNHTIIQGDYWQRRIDHAQRRYLAAIRTLATIRKLAVPMLQVNIAKRQTNIAASTAMISPPATGTKTSTNALVPN